MDPLDIEDTSDWLGCPTPLEMYKHSCLMLENEVQELTTQLRKARQDVFGLVEMHAAEAKECAKLRAELKATKDDLEEERRKNVTLTMNSNYLLSSKEKVICEYHRKLNELMGGKLPEPTINRIG
ncbi:hypothetical protein T3A99_12535 [Pseudomonas sp. N-137]|uniref:hypothetical protein n=1 Tax=Pseudomonas sp. N-137 TaxID=3108452 RepID=UPI002ADEBFDC|nr:hypothetical protein [Pseudomonas sp. N-137]MEA1029394.1 hypothetical protein [Pseudomonas sp. N-137]